MPAFVTHGPDIPERLLQAHEDGRVVFFCGAGISYPAGLPGFGGLVDAIYDELGTPKEPIEKQACKKEQYDVALDLLERRYVGQRLAVRTALANVLKPNFRKKDSTATHKALLQLATDRKGKVRLVTTNFDRIFERVIKRLKSGTPGFLAPLLPIPKPSRWHGVVYLHGLLPDKHDESEFDRLVLTSGDFGLAYLTERWAARFVSELFRNYTVCFVGYGINDPVLRYMMDALAADEIRGETRLEAYAFAGFQDEGQEQALIEWKAKGVTPLLYEVPAGTQDHSALHSTLREWGNTYRDGVQGKEMIIAQHATTPPLASSRSDFAVGRVLWALTDGLAAKHFADMNPVPPLKWLEPLAEAQFDHEDLARFGVTPKAENDNKLSFSVIRRPTPYTHSPLMCIAGMGGQGGKWDSIMFHLARWLTRHLNDPKLILWLAKQGGQLHEDFIQLIHGVIEDLDQLENDGKKDELDRILADAPKAVPGSVMRTLWRLLLSGRSKSHAHHSDLYDWLRRFKQGGLTPTLRIELREILTPCVTLREPFSRIEELAESREPERIKDLIDWDLELSSDHVHSTLRDFGNKSHWQAALPDLLHDFTMLLRDVLDLKKELGGAEDKSDLSYTDQPSISEHPQNRGFHDWTALIDLTRDAWLATVQTNPAQARLVAEDWWYVPYPLFKRLAFFAAANSDVITPREALDWLLANAHWWLWSVETQRETIRLLVVLAPKLDAQALAEMEQAILQGPPREMFKDDIEPKQWTNIVDHEVWLRLVKTQAAGARLGAIAIAKLNELKQQYPRWVLAEDERDEFPVWMDAGWSDAESLPPKFELAPASRQELVEWLKKYPSPGSLIHDDGWRERCRENFTIAAGALADLAHEDQWPFDRWREALQISAEDSVLGQSWPVMALLLVKAPDELIQQLAHSLSWWLKAESKTYEGREDLFFALIRRLLELEYQNGADGDPVSRAINHPVGHVTDALLNWWYRQEPRDAGSLKDEIKLLFTELCDTQVEKFRNGRVLLAAHAISMFRVDEVWAKEYLLPLFDWQRSEVEARVAWEGFLWSPRIYWPMLTAIKQPLLETARHYDQLGEHAEQYAGFLTFVALDPGDVFTTRELNEATSKLPAAGLLGVAEALTRALEGAGEQHGEYWCNRVRPYLKAIWPKSREVLTPLISERIGRLCVAAGGAFPEAMETLRHWLQPVEYTGFLIHHLRLAKLCEQFPSDALDFLDAVIGNDARLLPREFKQCLDDIGNANQALASDPRFVRLAELSKRRGIG